MADSQEPPMIHIDQIAGDEYWSVKIPVDPADFEPGADKAAAVKRMGELAYDTIEKELQRRERKRARRMASRVPGDDGPKQDEG